jgi:hypothetical protein
MWTDNHKRLSYVTYTYHYMDSEWKMNSRILRTGRFDRPHTAERIRDDYLATIAEYGIDKKHVVCVTDGGANVKKSTELLNLKRFACVAHSINNLIQNDLMRSDKMTELSNLITKLRKIQRTLIYKHTHLKQVYEDDRYKRIIALLDECSETDDLFDAETQFCDVNLENRGDFTGLKSISNVRWNCVFKLAQVSLNHLGICRMTLFLTDFYPIKFKLCHFRNNEKMSRGNSRVQLDFNAS